MVKQVDYEAVYDGENFSFIKVLMDDGSYDPIAGTNGPYGIITIVGYEVRISYPENLTQELIEKMVNQFTRKN